jgi:uncharacterized protein with von Willebrand factor type A (vWA) domain
MASQSSTKEGARNQLERAVDETLQVVKRLRKGARINVILFDSNARPWKRRLVKVTRRSIADLIRFLEAQRPSGGTNIYDPLETAVLTRGVEAVYLLSDGMPGSGKFVRDEDILREIGRINKKRRVEIHCVALGYATPLLRKLADGNHGTFVSK